MKVLLIAALVPILASAADGSFTFDPATGTVRASGIVGQISVFVGDEREVPMSGSTVVRDGVMVFTPRYPFVPGVKYAAVLSGFSFNFEIPKPVTESARLVRMYPSTDILPANQLKLYLEFSQPIARGGIWSRIHLIRDDGKAVELPFLEIDQELWTPDQCRLTVLFDPGRIKRGVTPQVEMGEVLEPGRSYTLVVDKELRDANNQALAAEFRRQFRISPALREGIDLKKWNVTEPKAGSSDPLVIEFDRPLDWALLQHTLTVKGITGAAVIDRDEMRWRFTPSQPWRSGRHDLVIEMSLEDLAGNRIGRPFDVDLFERVSERITTEATTLPFNVR